jgi:hypothetical protein
MNPLSRSLAALAAAIGFYGCDGIHLRKLKPGSATAARGARAARRAGRRMASGGRRRDLGISARPGRHALLDADAGRARRAADRSNRR